ncbi:MAG: hypothetical protein HWQ38_07970 [Nostoc sp. NMS7]|uniref:hypothetical protein n=1 Tax=Nostoc sp. NMS7 TaxID=2815391 RepID=UPI0025D3DCD1|nr:hypothetical protein [Nostoc sp. NMS7]MBN3946418.1 hypothetical protein [Nostoc sp. NMS7]
MYSGDINWSLTFQGFPTGSFEYTNIAESDLPSFEAAYNYRKGQQEKIYLKICGIDFVITSYGYDRKAAVWKDTVLINVYSVSIELHSKWEELVSQEIKVFKLVPLGSSSVSISTLCSSVNVPYSGTRFDVVIPTNSDKDYSVTIDSVVKAYSIIYGCYVDYNEGVTLRDLNSGGGSWSFTSEEIVTDGKNALSDGVGYRNTELTWGTGANKNNVAATPESTYSKKEPLIQTLTEVDEDLEKPPAGTLVIKNISDNTAEKKTKHTTVSINGSTDTEETWIWGFEYTAEDICLPNGLPFSSTPEKFWKLIEYQKTTHKYETIDGLSLNIKAKDPDPQYADTDLSGFVNLIIHPDYTDFATFSGQSGTFQSNAKYLTESNTQGWTRARFVQESDDKLITFDKDDPDYPLAKFQSLPSTSITAYSLINSRTLYKTDPNLPFSVEWKLYDELEPRIKELIDTHGQQISSAGKVGILYPDPNFVEPMAILVESHQSSSFAFTPNPESTSDYPLAPYITGEETFNRTDRTFVNDNQYKEKVSEFNSQSSGFSDLIEKVVFRNVLGKLPEATTRKSDWDKTDGTLTDLSNATHIQHYFMDSDDSTLIPLGRTKNYPTATTLNQAVLAAVTELQIEGMGKDTIARSLFPFYPNLRSGDRVVTPYNRFSNMGDWRIANASFKLTFRGISDKYGLHPICQCEPTSISLGLIRKRNVTTYKQDAATPTDDKTASDPKMSVTGGTTQTIGKVLANSPNRRRY